MRDRTLVVIFFIFNGLIGVGIKAASEMPVMRSVFIALLLMNASAGAFTLIAVLIERKPLAWRNIWVGVLAGIGSSVGGMANGRAAQMIPGYIVFPITSGGTLLLVLIIARLVFKEKIGALGVAGILVGIGAITLLSF